MIRGVDHIELIVRNLDEYIGFLETLGFELLTRTTHHGDSVEMGIPGQAFPIFELHQVTDEEVIGSRRSVVSDSDEPQEGSSPLSRLLPSL